jgi:hypothetical protein
LRRACGQKRGKNLQAQQAAGRLITLIYKEEFTAKSNRTFSSQPNKFKMNIKDEILDFPLPYSDFFDFAVHFLLIPVIAHISRFSLINLPVYPLK